MIGSACLFASRTHGRLARKIAASALLALALAAIFPSVILAGAQWGLVYGAFEKPSLPAVLVGLSDFLLHGGSYAVCIAVPWLLAHQKG